MLIKKKELFLGWLNNSEVYNSRLLVIDMKIEHTLLLALQEDIIPLDADLFPKSLENIIKTINSEDWRVENGENIKVNRLGVDRLKCSITAFAIFHAFNTSDTDIETKTVYKCCEIVENWRIAFIL